MPNETTKKCNHCKLTKSLSEFYHNTTKLDKHNGICKECQLKINKKNEGS